MELCSSPLILQANYLGFRGCLGNFIFRGSSELCMKHREIRWHFIGNGSMGLHQPLLNMGTGKSIRHLQQAQDNFSRSWKERFGAGTPSDVSLKASCKLSLKYSLSCNTQRGHGRRGVRNNAHTPETRQVW